MTDDIAERLRIWAAYIETNFSKTSTDAEALRLAAAEIERLREVLREIAEAVGDPSAYMIARAALAGEKNDE